MLVYDRKTQSIKNAEDTHDNLLRILYGTVHGRILLKLIFARPWFSKLQALYKKSFLSKKDIVPYIKKHSIDMKPYRGTDYCSFNDFFIRKRIIRNTSACDQLNAVADSKLLYYPINDNMELHIKDSIYTMQEIIARPIPKEFEKGFCLVYRLGLEDYHRYVFPDNGYVKCRYRIKGLLHTIRPVSAEYHTYSRNCREVSVLQTVNFGKVIQVEIGAMLVGHIVNHTNKKSFSKMEEKGYFEYGGSTILQFFTDCVSIDKDIIDNSMNGIETIVEIGDKIGTARGKGNCV